MNDDVLRAAWLSRAANDDETVSTSTIGAVLHEAHLRSQRERGVRILLASALLLLCPVLLWAAAHGRVPLIRGAYALMAAGVGIGVFAEWVWLRWSRLVAPGPVDMRSQVRTIVSVLASQSQLLRAALFWCAPIFAGAGMIAYWIAQAVSVTEGVALAVGIGVAWTIAAAKSRAKARAIDEQRSRFEQVLAELSASEL